MRLNIRTNFGIAAVLLVSACATPVPDSGASGVGFNDYATYANERLAREALLRGETPPQTTATPTATVQPGTTTPPADQPAIVRADPAAVEPNNVRISDEQDFDAVSGRETIESDAERIATNRQNYEVVQPTALPTRTGGGGPNIVEFALATNNAVGEQLYQRSAILAENRFNRNCGQYASQDLAQEAFLSAGGPERDRMGLDPDGDGFACYWDPTPFRAARRAIGN